MFNFLTAPRPYRRRGGGGGGGWGGGGGRKLYDINVVIYVINLSVVLSF